MEKPLFVGKSSQEHLIGLSKMAHEAVQHLTRESLDSGSDAELCGSIVKRYALIIPTIDWAKKEIKETTLEPARNYPSSPFPSGAKIPAFRFSIPFEGSSEAFDLSPKSSAVITQRVELIRGHLIFNIADQSADSAASKYKAFRDAVESNLQQLRRESDEASTALAGRITEAIKEWRMELSRRDTALIDLKERLKNF